MNRAIYNGLYMPVVSSGRKSAVWMVYGIGEQRGFVVGFSIACDNDAILTGIPISGSPPAKAGR